MTNQVGRVQFADGTILYPVVQGSSGGVSTRLYETASDAHAHRNSDFTQNHPDLPEKILDDESVDVWEWDGKKGEPSFKSRASKSLRMLTGPGSQEAITREYSDRLEEESGFGFGMP